MMKKTKRRDKAISVFLLLMMCGILLVPCMAAVLAEATPSEEMQPLNEETTVQGENADAPETREAPAQEQDSEPTKAPEESPTREPTSEPTAAPADTPTQEPTSEPTTAPTESPSSEPTSEPTMAPTESPTQEPTTQPTAEPTKEPESSPTPIIPAGKYTITITPPEKWQTGKATAKVTITDQNGTGWAHIKIVLAAPSAWTTIVDDATQAKQYSIAIKENSTLYVSITDHAGNVQAKSEAITCFDTKAPTVRAGISGEMICIEASDEISGMEAVFINGHRLTYKGDTVDAKIKDYADGQEKIAVQAVDRAGNYSATIYIKNPFYGKAQATTTCKPAATPKPTKRPSSGSSANKATPTPIPTATPEPTPEATMIPVQQVIPVATAAPTVVVPTIDSDMLDRIAEKVLESMISAPSSGSAFAMNGNMKTLDLLYSKATNKQFISVQTKKGETYYIVIDYDKPIDADGELYETYFLNLVDDYDLLAVLDDKDKATPEPTATPTPMPTATPTPTPKQTSVPEAPPQKDNTTQTMAMMMLMMVVLIGGGIGAFFMLKKKETSGKMPDIDDLEFDDDEDDSDGDDKA